MVRALIVNNRGETEVDPFNRQGAYDSWRAKLENGEAAQRDLSAAHAAIISAKESEMEGRVKKLEAMLLQRFADRYASGGTND